MSNALMQDGKEYTTDVLVIGTGLAGLYYCLQLLEHKPNIKIALISKVEAEECNSRYAQGGIAAVSLPDDSFTSHINDTLSAGDGLSYLPAVDNIIRNGPASIEQLSKYSVDFCSHDLAQEGGHSHRRIHYTGDQTGLTMTAALLHELKKHPGIIIFENHVAVNLITRDYPHRIDNQGEVLGAYILDCKKHLIHMFTI